MANEVLFSKVATIERCLVRIHQEYFPDPVGFALDFTRQDAAILNIQRACEAAIDMGQHIVREKKLGLVESSKDVFRKLEQVGFIDIELSEALQKMVGFRNIAVHDYTHLELKIVESIICNGLDVFKNYCAAILKSIGPI